MSKIIELEGKGIAVRGNDIDTDRIIPARFMRTITFDGLGEYAFFDERFDSQGNKKKHPFNDLEFENAEILVVNKNFGCGSSREHAPQALMRWGIKAIIGESFAEIFAGNCQLLGIPVVTVGKENAEKIQAFAENDKGEIKINVEKCSINFGDAVVDCEIPEGRKNSLIKGTWDTLNMLISNLEETKEKAKKIPYLNNYLLD